ncbi:hypothetical protein BDV29DRAFT_183487 [Aspergillus leporis]|uniref:F-box domain-containing protein n=1 Tax=Aspergillus leporis TaxID=41062 RepID=A0A5N5WP29_9EURO|nr:hypothetical protein BDV29DRAFT_183487 [Aspergillus leporis]
MGSVVAGSLSLLPNEVIKIVVMFLDRPALLNVAQANRHLRDVCLPEIFKSVKITFSTVGFKRLEQLATSPSRLFEHVRILEYRTSGLLDPGKPRHNVGRTSHWPAVVAVSDPDKIAGILSLQKPSSKEVYISVCASTRFTRRLASNTGT